MSSNTHAHTQTHTHTQTHSHALKNLLGQACGMISQAKSSFWVCDPTTDTLLYLLPRRLALACTITWGRPESHAILFVRQKTTLPQHTHTHKKIFECFVRSLIFSTLGWDVSCVPGNVIYIKRFTCFKHSNTLHMQFVSSVLVFLLND